VARSRELVARGRPAAVVARVAGIGRQAIYRRPRRPPTGQRRRLIAVDEVVLAIARSRPPGRGWSPPWPAASSAGRSTASACSGSCASAPWCSGAARKGGAGGRGSFRVERPDQPWRLDMTSVWVAGHGWCYLNAATCLLHARDHRLGDRRPLPRPGGDRRHPGGGRRARHPARAAHARHRQRLSVHRARIPRPPGRTRDHPPPRRLPRPREPGLHPCPGAPSSSSAASGAKRSRPSTKPAKGSAPTSTATTTDPTAGWPTAPRARSPPPGRTTTTS
jgi:hypothetical protein